MIDDAQIKELERAGFGKKESVFQPDEKREKTSQKKPFVMFKRYGTLEEAKEFGLHLADLIRKGLDNPHFPLMVDHGRVFVRAELEIVVDEEATPDITADAIELTEEGVTEVE
jgi:hypothetical protein